MLQKGEIILSHKEINQIGLISPNYKNIAKLYLSHNKLTNLNGIEQFKNLTHVSLAFNNINKW